MDDHDFQHLEDEENERALHDARRAKAVWNITRDPKLLLRTLYGLDEQPVSGFLNTGRVDPAILGAQYPVILTIYPFPKDENLFQAYGLDARRLESLVGEKHVIPLVQPPTRYSRLSYLHPLFRHKPRNYFIRSALFYAIFFDGTTDLVESDLPLKISSIAS